ncbi:chemokine XC receptor 1-like isoform X2 [Myxocyprinus asiaticus]|uniref:chemokine XC receptor 1-like isoform X2 n=1 Tax=Myxocyprinus asiaticus TaxID=70543 RepID=UPI002221F53C|nr:chemokine XC receptor 1-like isoform X2 [Myxocyprinus asiaticus]
MMYQETLQGNFNFSNDYDINYTYVDCPLITLEDGNSAGVIIAVCYSIIICISLPGNTFLLWVLLKQVGLSSSADCFLLHLTASDLIFTLTLVPWTINQIQGWIFGQVGCKLFTWGLFLGLYSYMMFLTVMTVHRYVAVVYPVFALSVWNRSRLYAQVLSAVVWLISVGCSLPELFFSELEDSHYGVVCVFVYNSVLTLLGYFTQIILFFLLPFLVIAFCYTRMAFIIHQSRITSRNHHHAVFNIFCIATCFFICWAPYNIFLFHISLRILGVTVLNQTEWDENIYCVTHVLAYSHCCLNPLIQIFGGRKFRNYLTWLRSFTRFSRRYSSYTFSNQSSFSGQTHL